MIPKLHEDFLNNGAKVLKEDTRILGVAVGGSYISGEMDSFSDLDIVIAASAEHITEIMKDRVNIAGKLGYLLSAFTGEHVGEPRLLICLYGPELLHVDLKFVSIDDVEKRVETPVILWEREEALTEKFKLAEAGFPTPSLQWIEDRFWVWIHYSATKLGRKEIFETIEFISFLRQTVIGPLILMKNGKLPRGVRRIEIDGFLELERLKKTIPEYTVESCFEAINVIIQLYVELREQLGMKELIKNAEAEEASREYLKNILRY